MDLSGPWRAAALDAELTRSGADPDLDDSGWPEIQIPGHWGQHDDFVDSDGPILFRRHFRHLAPELPRRTWLVLDGVIAQSDVWLDGDYVGDTAGYFVPHRFDVTQILGDREDHLLTVEVSASNQRDRRNKRQLTGSLQEGPLAPPGSPGGIWRPVRIEHTGTVAIRHARLVCAKATTRRATVHLRVVLDAAEAGDVELLTSMTGPDGQSAAGGAQTHTLAKGENRIEWEVAVDDPQLWWPASLGDQPLYDVSVAVRTDPEESEPSDRRHWRTGLRTISAGGSGWKVNGKRLFVKGIALGPQSRFLASVDRDRITDDLGAVAGAGLDLVRVHGHVAPPALYEEADRLGLLIWQDLPLVGGYATSARKAARVVARETVDQLGHHPSIAVWCAHDEPNGAAIPEPPETIEELPSLGRTLGRHLLPSWNRSVLDPIIRRELRAADASRQVITRSGSLPILTDVAGSDPHLWLGWHGGLHSDLAEAIRQWPRLGSFLGGFGSQSVAIEDWDAEEPRWQTAQIGSFERYVPRRAYADGESWALATRAYQADLIRSQIETVRRLKYRPTAGFCVMALADAEPSGGFGVLDHDRGHKPAYDALVDASRPVVVIADAPPDITSAGETLAFLVHAVSDLPDALGTTRVTARASCNDWSVERTWEGELGADACEHVGTLAFTVPELNGQMVIDLELVAGSRVATNRYQTVVIPPSETLARRSTPKA